MKGFLKGGRITWGKSFDLEVEHLRTQNRISGMRDLRVSPTVTASAPTFQNTKEKIDRDLALKNS